MLELYRDYFDIDPEYFPQVNQELINKQPDLWKKFYPHETFIKLVKDTISVLSRKQKVSIWVEGAYGTGKSHAVLTIKKLLEASEAETKEYFGNFPEQLDNDLYQQLQQVKNEDKKILTVHRYGTSDIEGDDKLVFAMQESIEAALHAQGMTSGQGALKNAVIQWLDDEDNKAYFSSLISGRYHDLFHGDTIAEVIEKLKTYSGDSLLDLMGRISQVANERHIKALSLDVDGLLDWIRAVIKENNLKAVLFVWDEFTEFFRRNMRSLTGFQKIVDLSATEPFYLMIITHDAGHIFPEGDKEFGKIRGRFITPICTIELPENMAFQLMGSAMKRKDDEQIAADWEDTVEDLYDRTEESRKLVKKKASITDKELKAILPIHPYAALLLKHISAAFDSNQRSMFDFIQNDHNDDVMGFQYFINHIGPEDDNPFLTVDELWDFFYVKGKDFLSRDIRTILDYYSHVEAQLTDGDYGRVLKTVLLMQAISQQVGSRVEVFVPNEDNINNAFEGSDLEQGAAGRIAAALERDKILYQMPIGNNKFQYAARLNVTDDSELKKIRENISKRTTAQLIQEGEITTVIDLPGALKQRYTVEHATAADIRAKANSLKNQLVNGGNKIALLVTYAKDGLENRTVTKSIREDHIRDLMNAAGCNLVIVDASVTELGADLFNQYVEAAANAEYQRSIDRKLSNQYAQDAKETLRKWKQRIEHGEFIVYSKEKPNGERAATIDSLNTMLAEINRLRYPRGLENGSAVTDQMWLANSAKLGTECGVKQETRGAFRSSNPKTKLENYIGAEAWQIAEYWKKDKYLPISKLKLQVDEFIEKAFEKNGRISIRAIYESLRDSEYGIMPCNLTAFVLGFVLKEYTENTYSWSDDMTSDVMSIEKLKDMVDEIIHQQITPKPRYKEQYIVTSTKEERAFIQASSEIFDISRQLCSSAEHTRERIRNKMKELSFPIWCLKCILDKETPHTDKTIVAQTIDAFSGIANNGNFSGSKSETDIANTIGKLCLANDNLIADMKALVTAAKCKEGMDVYLHSFEGGSLPVLAAEVGDNGQYINCLKRKFDADAANWVWNTDTADQKIREVILEYRIIVESNKYNPKALDFTSAIAEWCEKCKRIRISYLAAKTEWNELGSFAEMLCKIKKTGVLQSAQHEKFLEQLIAYGQTFAEFYGNQIPLFRKICYDLRDFSDEEVQEIYQMANRDDLYTMERPDYSKYISQVAEEYRSSKKSQQLCDLWKNKTGTDNPRVWSEKYQMPILIMIPADQIEKAQNVFNILGMHNPDSAAVERSLAYLQNADFYESLENEDARNEAFEKQLLGEFATLLTDVSRVKQQLMKTNVHPYNWYGNGNISNEIRNIARHSYDVDGGCEKALEKIDTMDIVDVKRYLKDLIRENINVGIAIIKDN